MDADKDETKQVDDKFIINNEVRKEGYLDKKSLYLKKIRKRFIILRENHLFCYENDKKTKITEFIKLSLFEWAQLSEEELAEFELKPKNKKEKTIVFAAESRNKAEEWVNHLNCSMNADDVTRSIEKNQSQKDEEQGIMYKLNCPCHHVLFLFFCC